MLTKDVFTPGKYPSHTFVDDHIHKEQAILTDALATGGMVVSLGGPSKAGKTVFVENVVGNANLLHITGAGVDSAEKLWGRVFDLIGTPVQKTSSSGKGFQGTISGSVGGDAGVFVKAKGEVGASGTWSSNSSASESQTTDSLQLLIRELKGTNFVLFIDDFHYIAAPAKVEIAQHIKEAVRNDVRVVCASVPYHSDDVIRANADLRGRIVVIDLDYWKPEVLARIAERGFGLLGIGFDSETIVRYAREAAGSPQLMQAICLNACYEMGVRETDTSGVTLPKGNEFLRRVCNRTSAMADYSSIVAKMKDGPKTRGTERTQHVLKDGSSTADVYPIVLRALALDPPELTFRYANLGDRIQKICRSDPPSGSSITGACHHIATIANDAANQSIVEWDPANDVLDLRDPYLLFYLRWSEFYS